MSNALRHALSRGLANARVSPASAQCRGFAERTAEMASPAGTARAHGEGAPSSSSQVTGVLLPVLVGGGAAWYFFGREHRPRSSRSSEVGSGQVAQQEKRPPSAGASGQQAQRTFSDNRSAEKDNDANIKLKTAKASGTSDDSGTGSGLDPQERRRSGGGGGFTETNKEQGPNYNGKGQ